MIIYNYARGEKWMEDDMSTNIKDFHIRFAVKKDSELIIKYIKDLARYENELDAVTLTREDLEKNMFDDNGAEALIGEFKDKPIGFAFFYNSFSTFEGKVGIHLVDLYIEPNMRGKGYGKAMLSCLAHITKKRGGTRLEWWVHDWNESAASHYKNWGATMVKNIRVYRMNDDTINEFSSFYRKNHN